MLEHTDEIILFLVTIGAFVVAIEVGYRLGARRFRPGDETARRHAGSLQTSMLGLLSLLLGFNFAMASSRFDSRKMLLQDEVNAIASSHLRGQLLPEPQRHEFAALLSAYVDSRIVFMQAGSDAQQMEVAHAESNRIEEQL